jgi:N-acetylmuramoyl-L-alanine amidase
MRDIEKIVIHCSDTPRGKYFDVDDIRRWHTDPKPEGNGWSDVGYHYIVLLNGDVQKGRLDHIVGSHAYGHNSKSIGICYIGGKDGDTRTLQQKVSLETLLRYMKLMYPHAEILGHRDLPSVSKTCPSFDAKSEYNYI